jgi:hypothetical protein
VLPGLPEVIARHLHGQTAAWLEAGGGEPARVAAHWEAAGQRARALPALRAAAERAHRALREGERIASCCAPPTSPKPPSARTRPSTGAQRHRGPHEHDPPGRRPAAAGAPGAAGPLPLQQARWPATVPGTAAVLGDLPPRWQYGEQALADGAAAG